MTLLTLYTANPNSTSFTSAELLVAASGAAQGSFEPTTVNTSTGWGQLTWGGTTAFAAGGSIGTPNGKGAYYDGGSATLVGTSISAGNWSGTVTLAVSQAGKTVTGDLVFRAYKYNTATTTYTSIGTITLTSQSITSTITGFNFASTSLPSMSFSTNESVYIDIWINIATNNMTSGGIIQNYYSNGASTGYSGSSFVTPGYGSVTNTWTANDVGLTPGEVNAEVLAQTQTDSVTSADTNVETLVVAQTDTLTTSEINVLAPTALLTDTALSLSDALQFNTVIFGWTVLAQDTVQRANVIGSFGTSTGGATWTQIIPTGNAAGTLAVTSNEAVIVNTGVDTIVALGSSSGDGQVLSRVSINNTNDIVGLQLRTQNISGSVSDYKFLWYSAAVHLNKSVSNANTQITTVSFTMSVNTFYWMKFLLQGTSLYGKIWADGSAEPAAWTTTTTDSSVTGTGQAAVIANTNASSTGVKFDNFYAISSPLADIGMTPSDNGSQTTIAVPVDTLTGTETTVYALAESVNDTTLTLTDTSSITSMISSILTNTDTVTALEAMSEALATFLVDTALSTSDSIAATLTATYALVDTAPTTSDTITGTGTPLLLAYNAGWIVLGNDTGTRANSSGTWGTSTDNQSWSIPTGAATLAVTSNELTATACTTSTYIKLGSNTSADAEVLVRTSVNNTSSNGNGVFLRMTGSTTAYRCRMNASSSSIGFGFAKLVAGTSTNLASITFTESTNTFYWIRFRLQGINLYGKVWASGTAEPAAWTVTTTDSSITGAGTFGIYDSGSATNNIASYDNFYCVDNALSDNVVPLAPDTIVDSLLFIPTESQTLVEVVTETDVFSTISDVALSLTETAAFTETFVGAEQSIANLTNYLPGDSLSYTNSVVGIVQVDTLTCNDAGAFTQVFAPIESVNSTETLAILLVMSMQEGVVTSDTLVSILENLQIDNVTSADSAIDLAIFLITDTGINVSDSFISGGNPILSDTLSTTEAVIEALAFSGIDTAGTTSDSIFSSIPIPLPDTALLPSDAFTATVNQTEIWQGTNSELKTYTLALQPVDTLTEASTPLYTETFAAHDTALSISDVLLSGVPSNFRSDTLTVTETAIFTGSIPSALFTDQLIATDTLFVLDNFTDFCFVSESYVTIVTSNTLEPRSNLYVTIMADNPTVYYQMTEGQFSGLFQRDGQDNVNNASNPTLIGAILSYTWAQIEPSEGVYNWSVIDNNIIPWSNLGKSVIIRVHTASTIANNLVTHYAMTATQATPSWVFAAGAPMVTGADSAVYPVYWDTVYQAKYAAFITQLALRYDTNVSVRGVVASAGVNGSTTLEKSGDTAGNTLALWGPRGYSNTTWASAIHWVAGQFAMNFARTPILLSVDNAFIVPDTSFNINYCLDVAVQHAIWAFDENASVNTPHIGQQWAIVPLVTIARAPTSVTGSTVALDLAVSINDQSDFAAVWEPDVTAPGNQPTLTTYAAKSTQKFFHDIAPLQKNVTVSGEVYPTSRILTGDYLNGAQQFDGSSGYGMMTSAFQGDTTKWTMKASIYPTVLPTQEAIIVANGQTGVAAFGGYAMGIAAGALGGAGQNLCAYIPGYGWYDSGYTFPAVNTWYSCFMVFDGTSLTCYVNGAQTALTNFITPYAMQPRATIGMIWDAVQLKQLRYFTGSIDEIAIYPVALTGTRIAAISAAELGLTDATTQSTSVFTAQEQLTVSDSASLTTVTQSITDTLTVVDIFAQSSINVAFLGETILIDDFFNRSNQTGWGVATDGQIWTQPVANGTPSIVGNQGQLTAMSGANVLFLGSTTATLIDGRIHVTMQNATDATVGLIIRATDSTHYYVARLNATNFGIVKVNGGSNTNILDVAFTPSLGAGYWIRFRAVGSLLMAKYWIDTASEPNSFSSTGTDATFTSGQTGVYASTTTSADIYTFSNFFAVDNYLTDFVPLSELYVTTAILPPFVESVLETEITLITDSIVTLDGSTTVTEVFAPNTIMLGSDQLVLVPSTEAWIVTYIPVEPLTVTESLLSNSPTPLASDVLIVTDASTVTNQPILIDSLSLALEIAAKVIIFAPIDNLAVQEGISLAPGYISIPDLLFSNEYVVYTPENKQNEATTTTDSMGFTDIFLPVDALSGVDLSTETAQFFLTDSTVVTSDTIATTLVEWIAEYATGDGILDDPTLFLLSEALLDTCIATDVIIPTNSPALIDSTPTLSDTITPTNNPSLVDSVTTLNTLVAILFSVLSDTAQTTELIHVDFPGNFIVDIVTATDSITPTNNLVLIDACTLTDTLFSAIAETLNESVVETSSITGALVSKLADTVTSSDTENTVSVSLLIDISVLTTEYVTTPIISNSSDPTLTPIEVNMQAILFSLVIDTAMIELEALNFTGIFLLGDTAIIPGDSIIESSSVAFAVDALTALDTISVTDVPQGLTESLVASESLSVTLTALPLDALSETEITLLILSSAFSESFVETEITLLALVTSITADVLGETEILMAVIQESDSTTLAIADISTVTNIGLENDVLFSASDLIAEGVIFVPVDPLTVTELLIPTIFLFTTDATPVTEIYKTTPNVVPIDTLFNSEVLLVNLTEATPVDSVTNTDFSMLAVNFVPVDTLTYTDALTLQTVFFPMEITNSVDASTTKVEQKNTDTLSPGTSVQAWIIGYAPTETLQGVDVSTERLLVFLVDTMSVQDVLPMLGYGLLDKPLNSVEVLQYSKVTYVTVTAQIASGKTKGIIDTSKVTTTLFSGKVKGSIP